MSRRIRWLTYSLAALLGFVLWRWLQSSAVVNEDLSAAPSRSHPELRTYYDDMDRLAAEFPPLPKPQEGDWLAKYPEGGQTFDQYVVMHKEPVIDQHAEIHLQPLGEFTPSQMRLLEQTGDFLGRYFGMEVKRLELLPLDDLPPDAQRPRDDGRSRQLLTTHLMYDVLLPRRSDQAAALLGFVSDDLWGGDHWNWLFGQASIEHRVGVWSLFRNGDADGSEAEYRLCLLRTLKTAAHETGHILGMPHCVAYGCCMNGSNHREESDQKPLEFCPECQAKVWWTCRLKPRERYRRLIEFAEETGLRPEAEFWRELDRRLSVEK